MGWVDLVLGCGSSVFVYRRDHPTSYSSGFPSVGILLALVSQVQLKTTEKSPSETDK